MKSTTTRQATSASTSKVAAPDAVRAYIERASEPARTRLQTLRAAIRAVAPSAIERIAYGMPTWHQGENLIHIAAFANHVGVYPGPSAIVAFADELAGFATSKGAIRIPHDRALPVALVRRIVRWRVAQVVATSSPAKGATKGATRAVSRRRD